MLCEWIWSNYWNTWRSHSTHLEWLSFFLCGLQFWFWGKASTSWNSPEEYNRKTRWWCLHVWDQPSLHICWTICLSFNCFHACNSQRSGGKNSYHHCCLWRLAWSTNTHWRSSSHWNIWSLQHRVWWTFRHWRSYTHVLGLWQIRVHSLKSSKYVFNVTNFTHYKVGVGICQVALNDYFSRSASSSSFWIDIAIRKYWF